jgi:hypothetical protein
MLEDKLLVFRQNNGLPLKYFLMQHAEAEFLLG